MALVEKFWKEIRALYNQEVPWVQIMIDCGASHRVSRNRLLQKLATLRQVHNLWVQEWRNWGKYLWVGAAAGRTATSLSSAQTPWSLPTQTCGASSPSTAKQSSWVGSCLKIQSVDILFLISINSIVVHNHQVTYLQSIGCSKWFWQMSAVSHRNRCQLFFSFFSFKLFWEDVKDKMARPVIIVELLHMFNPKLI